MLTASIIIIGVSSFNFVEIIAYPSILDMGFV